MIDLVLHGGRIVTPDEVHVDGWLGVQGGRIHAIGAVGTPEPEARQRLGLHGAWLLPGFIDVHTHGAVGYDTMDADPAGLQAIAAHHARHGVTGFLATTWTADHPTTLAALEAVAEVCGGIESGAQVLGAHMEGPYLNPERCGAQERRSIRVADSRELSAYLDTGVVRLITLAPEIEANLAVVRTLLEHEVTTSIGHSQATYEQLRTAVDAGVRHATHTGNAMRAMGHREPGTVGGVLDLPELIAEVIADGVHVHPALLRLLHRVKGSQGVVLVTDSIGATGLADGPFAIGDRLVEVRDGAVRLPDGALAGSVLTMDRALRVLVEATGQGVEVLWPTVSLTPARTMGIAEHKGHLTVGADADLVVLDEELTVRTTIVAGRIVHDSDTPASAIPTPSHRSPDRAPAGGGGTHAIP